MACQFQSKHTAHTARTGSYSGSYSGKRVALYVANLTWVSSMKQNLICTVNFALLNI